MNTSCRSRLLGAIQAAQAAKTALGVSGCNSETGIDMRLVQRAWDGAFESDDPGRGGGPGV